MYVANINTYTSINEDFSRLLPWISDKNWTLITVGKEREGRTRRRPAERLAPMPSASACSTCPLILTIVCYY